MTFFEKWTQKDIQNAFFLTESFTFSMYDLEKVEENKNFEKILRFELSAQDYGGAY